jgi:GAF domain-containing protein
VNRLPGGGVGFVLLGGSPGGGFTTPHGVPIGSLIDVGVGDGIVGSLGDREPEIVNDVAADPRASEDERELSSLMIAPLRARGSIVGVIGTATTEPHEYRAADLKVLAAIAALTGPAIDQAQARETGTAAGVG